MCLSQTRTFDVCHQDYVLAHLLTELGANWYSLWPSFRACVLLCEVASYLLRAILCRSLVCCLYYLEDTPTGHTHSHAKTTP